MSFVKYSGNQTTVEWYVKTASTAFARNSLVAFTSGQLTQSATSLEQLGIILSDVVSTDSDYATANKRAVMIPQPDDIFIADVIGGTAAASNVGAKFDIDSTYLGINMNGTTYKQLLVVGFISSTQVLVKILGLATHDLS